MTALTKDQAAFNANVRSFIAKMKAAAEEFNSDEITRQNRAMVDAVESDLDEDAVKMMDTFLFSFNAMRDAAGRMGIETDDVEF
jgi:hypothetical protein